VVATQSLLVVAAQVVQAPNDKQQIEPMLTKIGTLPENLGKPDTLLADSGYFSEANVALCVAAVTPRFLRGDLEDLPEAVRELAFADYHRDPHGDRLLCIGVCASSGLSAVSCDPDSRFA
jgi:hypothetical protein